MGILLWGLLTSIAAAQLAPSDYIGGHYVAKSPAAEFKPGSEARRLAAKLATHLPGAFVVQGKGRSMQPLYPHGTLLVVQPVPYEKLARGMTVVFRTPDNQSLAHVLVARTADGWRTSGLNNRRADFIPVQADDIRGVVVAAFAVVDGAAVAWR
ncbi:MAG: hypothetical protein RLZZ129_1652 [Verrucomicrobiota bacterium]|jgi:hypothetical protein|nr:S24/S26 family peptidase [Opitutaceae bacterium]